MTLVGVFIAFTAIINVAKLLPKLQKTAYSTARSQYAMASERRGSGNFSGSSRSRLNCMWPPSATKFLCISTSDSHLASQS